MRLFCVHVLVALLDGLSSVSRLAAKAGVSVSGTSKAVKELEQRRLVERQGRKVFLARNPLANELKALAGKFSIEKLLGGRKEQILLAVIEGRVASDLQKDIGLSAVQMARLLRELSEIGAISGSGGKIVLGEAVVPFVSELKKTAVLREIEPTAVLLFSNKFKLKKMPLGAKAAGSLTAFSRFAEFGVDYAIVNDFFVEPAHKAPIEAVFVHALAASENKKDLAMCLIFYEKNKGQMELRKIVDLAREFNVLGLFLDCLAYLDKREVKQKERFLPWPEFLVIGKNYGLKSNKQKFSREDLEQLLSEIGGILDCPLNVYLIGGCNLSLQGIKAATKDIDLVVKNEKDFEALAAALNRLGFERVVPKEKAYIKMNPSGIFEKPGKPRVDIFTRIVCNALSLSGMMADKALERKFGLLSVNFLKPEDIILFKAITERDSDLDDIATIIRVQKPDWNFFLQELDRQHEKTGRLFCLSVLDTMALLEEKEKIVVPIKQKLEDLCLEKSVLFLARKPASVKEMLQKIDFPESTVRNKVQQLVKAKKLKKISGTPFKVIATGLPG